MISQRRVKPGHRVEWRQSLGGVSNPVIVQAGYNRGRVTVLGEGAGMFATLGLMILQCCRAFALCSGVGCIAVLDGRDWEGWGKVEKIGAGFHKTCAYTVYTDNEYIPRPLRSRLNSVCHGEIMPLRQFWRQLTGHYYCSLYPIPRLTDTCVNSSALAQASARLH